jgi:hypothetical protein
MFFHTKLKANVMALKEIKGMGLSIITKSI